MTGRTPWWAYVINGISLGACSVLLTTSNSASARTLALIGLLGAVTALALARLAARSTT